MLFTSKINHVCDSSISNHGALMKNRPLILCAHARLGLNAFMRERLVMFQKDFLISYKTHP